MLRVAGLTSRNLVGIGRPVLETAPPPAPFYDGTAYSITTDYSGSGIRINGYMSFSLTIDSVYWTTTAGFDAIYALTTGDRIKVNTSLSPFGTGDSVATLTTGWTELSPGRYVASVTLSVAISGGQDITVVTLENTGSGGGSGGSSGGGTYVVGTDYTVNAGPPGISFMSPGGPYTTDGVIVNPDTWTNTTGSTALLALTTGDTFTVSATPAGGGSAITSTITLLSGWSSLYGNAQRADMSASPPVSTDYPDYYPFSVIIGAGGGTEYTVIFGGWGGGGGASQVQFGIDSSNTEAITALSALTTGATITVKQGSSSTTVTITSAFNTFPAGPGTTGFAAGTVESNQYYALGFDQLTSIVV